MGKKQVQVTEVDAITKANQDAIAGEPAIEEAQEQTFEERTTKTELWRDEDGKQVNA